MSDELKRIKEAGRKAAIEGRTTRECPYIFIASPYWKDKDYDGFNREYRPKLDAWMRGFIEARKAVASPQRRVPDGT